MLSGKLLQHIKKFSYESSVIGHHTLEADLIQVVNSDVSSIKIISQCSGFQQLIIKDYRSCLNKIPFQPKILNFSRKC